MPRFIAFALILTLCACKSIPTTKQTAETLTDAAETQAKIDRADELAEEIETAVTEQARKKATDAYVKASKQALDAAQHTINNLRKSLIDSEDARGRCDSDLSAARTNAEKFRWLKWLLIIGGPLSIIGAFLLGRKL